MFEIRDMMLKSSHIMAAVYSFQNAICISIENTIGGILGESI